MAGVRTSGRTMERSERWSETHMCTCWLEGGEALVYSTTLAAWLRAVCDGFGSAPRAMSMSLPERPAEGSSCDSARFFSQSVLHTS